MSHDMDQRTFESARTTIAARAQVLAAEFRESAFGSWFVTIAGSPERRLAWDGKERWLVIEALTSETRDGLAVWKDLWLKHAASDDDMFEAIDRLLQEPSQNAT